MSRLTRYHQESLLTDEGGYYEPNASNYYDIVVKLGKLEDLEDELGCPLDVVFNALKQGCYIQDEGYFECPDIYFHSLEMEFVIGWANKDNMGYELLKDYKKTWFLKGDLSE